MVSKTKTTKKLSKAEIIKNPSKYVEALNKISRSSNLSTVELVAVLFDIKPAMADAITLDKNLSQNLKEIKKLCEMLSLEFSQSRFKYVINSPRGIYEEIPINDPREGKIILGISKSISKAEKAAEYYHLKCIDSKYGEKFGRLMGYPECCLKFGDYLNNSSNDPNNFGYKNPAVESLKRSKKFAWQLNVFTGSLLSHYPCSLNCQKSIDYVDKTLAVLDKIMPEFSSYVKFNLKEPASLYWSCADRILLFGEFKKDKEKDKSEIKYHKSISKITSAEFYQKNDLNYIKELEKIEKMIKKGDRIVMNPNNFIIYQGQKKLCRIEKENKYTPILVKPD